MWHWTMNWLHNGGIFDDSDIPLHECQTLPLFHPSLKRNHFPIMSAIIRRLDNQSTSQGGVIFHQLELLTRYFLVYFLCLNLEFVGNLLYDAFITFDELYRHWQ